MSDKVKPEIYAASPSERASLIDWYKEHSNTDLHDDALNTLCAIAPPEQFGESEDCEALQNLIRVMFYRLVDADHREQIALKKGFDQGVDEMEKAIIEGSPEFLGSHLRASGVSKKVKDRFKP